MQVQRKMVMRVVLVKADAPEIFRTFAKLQGKIFSHLIFLLLSAAGHVHEVYVFPQQVISYRFPY
jgi:hypothetical protein